MAPRTVRRTDDQRLGLFARRYDEMAREPAAHFTWSWTIHFDTGVPTLDLQEPSKQEVRSLLMDVRKLDSRGEDLYLPGVIALLADRVHDPIFSQGLLDARNHYDIYQKAPGMFEVEDARGVMKLRDAFELWIYRDHFHDDFDKEQRWDTIALLQGMIQSNAVAYMEMLLQVAAYCRRVIEVDPALASIDTPTRSPRAGGDVVPFIPFAERASRRS